MTQARDVRPFGPQGAAIAAALVVGASAMLAPDPASAIVMRDDVDESAYLAFGAEFDAVGRMSWSPDNDVSFDPGNRVSSGTLVRSAETGVFKFLTCAHCVDADADGTVDSTSFTLSFGAVGAADATPDEDRLLGFSVDVPVADVAVNPDWAPSGGNPQFDMAVLSFGADPGLEPLAVTQDTGIGEVGTLVGYGRHGTGDDNTTLELDNRRRAGTNVIEGVLTQNGVSTNTLVVDLDGPDDADANQFNSATPTPLEAGTAGGDSGGPLIHEGNVIGQLFGGFNDLGDPNEYGDVSMYSAVALPSNTEFLTGAGVRIGARAQPVPLPASGVLLLGALGGIAALRRVRAARRGPCTVPGRP